MQINFTSLQDLTQALKFYKVPTLNWRLSIKALYQEYLDQDQQFFLDLTNGVTSKALVVNVELTCNQFTLFEELVEYDIGLPTYEAKKRPHNLGVSEKIKSTELSSPTGLILAARRALAEELGITHPQGEMVLTNEVIQVPLALNQLYSDGQKGLMTQLEIYKVKYFPTPSEVKPNYYEYSIKDGRPRKITFGWKPI
jgi:hypothetical protein